MDIDADQDDGGPNFPHTRHYDISLNHKIMVGAIVSLCLVVLLVLILHLYSRFATRRRSITRAHQSPLDHPKTGLDPAVLASLPSFVLKDQETDNKTTECAVCLSVMEMGKIARLLPNCDHIFHVDCIDKWLISQSTCPICRAEVCPP